MIQRIQTIFLLLAALFMGATTFFPLFEISFGEIILKLFSLNIGVDYATWGIFTWVIFTFAVFTAILPLINIFLYKMRKLQISIALLTAFFIVAYYVIALVSLNIYLDRIPTSYTLNIQIGIIFPVIALIFDLLAVWKIKKDEKLVRSLDRIR